MYKEGASNVGLNRIRGEYKYPVQLCPVYPTRSTYRAMGCRLFKAGPPLGCRQISAINNKVVSLA